jgi:hypothetical protein
VNGLEEPLEKERMVLRSVFGPEGEGEIGDWRNLLSEGIQLFVPVTQIFPILSE